MLNPTPPLNITDASVELVACVVSVNLVLPDISSLSLILTSLLNVTGPSNSDNAVLDFPPSTTILSLIVASSNTTLNLPGSSPVTEGIGVSKDVSSPVNADFFWLPM